MKRMFRVRKDAAYRARAEAVFDAPLPVQPATGLPITPALTLEWERAAQRLYHSAMLWRICADMGFEDAALAQARARLLQALTLWRSWRPECGESFDRNNWSNGYLPGAWGLLGGDAERFHRMGTAYLRRLPGVGHWAMRSTNHGAVIYASYLVGAVALEQPLEGLPALRAIIAGSLQEGCYPEGLNYMGFVLSEVIPLVAATWDGQGALRDHANALLPGLAGAKAMYRWSADRTGRVFAPFGDIAELKVYDSVLAFADGLSGAGDLRHALRATPKRKNWRIAPLLAPLPGGGQPVPREDFITPNHIAVCKTPALSLCILGSRLHLTHNAAHDCGSFFFETDRCRVTEAPGREAFRHNVPLLSDAPGFPDCAGPVPFAKRRLHGSVQRLGPGAWRVIAPRAFQGCPSEITAHVRDFHLVGAALLVLDRVFVEGPGQPVAQFHAERMQALWAVERRGDRLLCPLRRARRGWLGAYLFGSEAAMTQEDGAVLLAGARYAFPPPRPRAAAAAVRVAE